MDKNLTTNLMNCFFLTVLLFVTGGTEHRNYHRVSISAMAGDNPADWSAVRTHVEVRGYVTYARSEGDRDTHLRVCDAPSYKSMDRAHCIIAECIPELPCSTPKVGSEVLVRGISRYDAESPGHHWWEIHPVESLKVVQAGTK